MDTTHSLLAPSDIAELVGVSRAAVSNWRKRSDDFPPQVAGTAAKPLFSRDAAVRWLTERGYEIRQDKGESQVWSAMNALRGSLHGEEAAQLLLSLACARTLSEEAGAGSTPWDNLREQVAEHGIEPLARAAAQHATSDPRWLDLVPLTRSMLSTPTDAAEAAVARVNEVPLASLADVVDFVLSKIARASIRGGLEHGFIESRVSTTLASLAAATHGDVLYDPACGIGAALTAVMAGGPKRTRIVGHDINHGAATQAAQRMYLRHLPAEITTVDVMASDPAPDLRADVIVAEPPFGLQLPSSFNPTDRRWAFGLPAKSAADLAWIQHAVTHLSEEGTAFVITPVSTLLRSNERNVRAELVRRGCVEAVIALPGKMLPNVGVNLVVWVLRAPRTVERLEIAFVDGTGVDDVEHQVGAWLTALRAGDELTVPHQAVDVRDVLAADTDLTPTRWIQLPDRDPAEIVDEYQTSWHNLTQALENVSGSGESLKHFAGTTDSRVVTVGDLADQGLIEIRQGRASTADIAAELEPLILTHRHVRTAELTPVLEEPEIPSNLRQSLTVEQDVLVSTQGTVSALYDDGGLHLVGTGVYRLRVTNNEHLSPRYLALVLSGAWNGRFQVGATITRADVRLLEVPLVPLADQRSVILADIAVQVLADEAEKLLREAKAVRRTMLDALRYNVELPAGDQ